MVMFMNEREDDDFCRQTALSMSNNLNPSEKAAVYTEKRRLIINPEEIMLFEFYMEKAGEYLDIATENRHFSTTIVSLALRCPVLYYACLAYSAAVLYQTKQLRDASLSEMYSTQCFGLMIPALNNPMIKPC
jgi:hypothetical protein